MASFSELANLSADVVAKVEDSKDSGIVRPEIPNDRRRLQWDAQAGGSPPRRRDSSSTLGVTASCAVRRKEKHFTCSSNSTASIRHPTAAAPMRHMNKNNSGPYIGRDRLYGGIQITEPRLLLGP